MKNLSLAFSLLSPFAYLSICAFGAAVLAYPLHLAFPMTVDFQSLVFKTAEIFMALSLIPIGRKLAMNKLDIGVLAPMRQLLRQMGKGFFVGALMFWLHVSLLVLLDVRVVWPGTLSLARVLSLSWKGVLIGLAVALLEEPIFRGFLLGFFCRKTNRFNAVVACSFYFAALHFLSTDMRPAFEEVRWDTGFIIVSDAFANLLRMHLDSFLALFAAGAFLSCVKLLYPASGLSYCIGIHAGWVFIIKTTNPLTVRSIVSPLQNIVSGFDGNIGYLSAAWASLLIVFMVIKIHRKARNHAPSPSIDSL